MRIGPVSSAALASLYSENSSWVASRFHNLHSDHLEELASALMKHHCHHDQLLKINDDKATENDSILSEEGNFTTPEDIYPLIGTALLRRITYGVLSKKRKYHANDVEKALKYWPLPADMRERLASMHERQDSKEVREQRQMKPSTTWYDELQYLKERANGDGAALWEAIESHPMTEYVVPKCSNCGHAFPDEYDGSQISAQKDKLHGIVEVEPTDEEKEFICGGWYRGPRKAVAFQFTCPDCGAVQRWHRSFHPKIILNPSPSWGRLCGEQEDLKASLASYTGIPLRRVVPLDWDHIWSEYKVTTTIDTPEEKARPLWSVVDDSARNFAVRLEEGIGAWTRVLVISEKPEWSGDATDAYLRCSNTIGSSSDNGRVDPRHESNLKQYRSIIEESRMDPTGKSTQRKTVNGFVLEKAGMKAQDVTAVIQKAVVDFHAGVKWWTIPHHL